MNLDRFFIVVFVGAGLYCLTTGHLGYTILCLLGVAGCSMADEAAHRRDE